MRVVMLAPPGAGKGTQGDLIARRFGLPHISTGDLLRMHMSRGTPIGEHVREYVYAGELVPDELMLEMVVDALRETCDGSGYVLDGFPRTVGQARELDEAAAVLGVAPQVVVHLDVDDNVVLDRLLARAGVENRPDDNEQTIRRRLDVYHAQTAPVVEHYAATGALVWVDAARPVEVVAQDVQDALDALATFIDDPLADDEPVDWPDVEGAAL